MDTTIYLELALLCGFAGRFQRFWNNTWALFEELG